MSSAQHFLLIIFLLSFFSCKIQSQTLILDDTTNLKVGVYRTFKEFKYNSPSIPTGFTVRPEQRWFRRDTKESKDSSVHTIYHLLLPDSYSKRDSIWGFCDGKNVYVKTKRLDGYDFECDKIEYFGRYCLFHSWFGGSIGFTPTSILVNAVTSQTDSRLIKKGINFNNGYIFGIDEMDFLKSILERDQEIHKVYKQDKERKNKSFYYLKIYSEKHRDEIKP